MGTSCDVNQPEKRDHACTVKPDTASPDTARPAAASKGAPILKSSGISKPEQPGKGEGEQALPEPEPAPAASLAHTPTSGGLVYNPSIRQVSQTHFQICGRREVSGTIPWGFWGGILVAFVAYFLITGSQGFWSVLDIVWALIALSVGLLLFRYGRRSSLRLDVLCGLDLEREVIFWPASQPDTLGDKAANPGTFGQGELALNFNEIEEVVFAMIDYPLSMQKDDVDVHAFTLLVRDGAQRLIPIIEATPAKTEAHEIAKMIAGQLRLKISYVGKGFE